MESDGSISAEQKLSTEWEASGAYGRSSLY